MPKQHLGAKIWPHHSRSRSSILERRYPWSGGGYEVWRIWALLKDMLVLRNYNFTVKNSHNYINCAHRMRYWHIVIAEYTWYFSTASATSANVPNATSAKSGWGWRYIYWRSSSSTVEVSDSETISLSDGSPPDMASAAANPSACISKFFRCTLNKTPSEDRKVMSESGAQTVTEDCFISWHPSTVRRYSSSSEILTMFWDSGSLW